MTIEDAQKIEHFFCQNCLSEAQNKLQNSHATSRPSDTKVNSAITSQLIYFHK